MFVALDESGNRIDVSDAIRGSNYYCPHCHGTVVVREGEINAKHFAHQKGVCVDEWQYDMSQWHRDMQAYFPLSAREVIVTANGKTHRADILVGDVVIEFQHSPISAREYADRNCFFAAAGYRLAWVFDVREQVEEERLFFPDRDDDQLLMAWKNPPRMFSAGPFPNDKEKRFSIWLALNDDNGISKVIWSLADEGGSPSFRRIVLSEHGVCLETNMDTNRFFYSREDYLLQAIAELKREHRFSVKYVGKKGEPQQAYICPRRKEFGIDLFSAQGCKYCAYCYMMARKKRPEKSMWAVYCCYPKQVRECSEPHPGYECDGAYEFDI